MQAPLLGTFGGKTHLQSSAPRRGILEQVEAALRTSAPQGLDGTADIGKPETRTRHKTRGNRHLIVLRAENAIPATTERGPRMDRELSGESRLPESEKG